MKAKLTLSGQPSSSSNPRTAAQSEIFYIQNGQFFVLARDSGAGYGQDNSQSLYRQIDVFDIKPATDIKSPANDAATGAIASKDGVLKPGITPATYCPFLDFNVNSQLGRFGLRNGGPQEPGLLNEKWESIAIAPVDGKDGDDDEWFLISLSDNDFITQDGTLDNSPSANSNKLTDCKILDRGSQWWQIQICRWQRVQLRKSGSSLQDQAA